MAIKHIGKLKSNKRKVAVAYRTLPNDPEHALIVSTENLTDSDHDVLMQLVESPSGQDAGELAEAMARTRLSDGSVMLARFHSTGKLMRVPTADVDMMPTNTDTINLAELNKVIAEQKGVSIADLALKDDTQPLATATATTAPASTPSNEATAAPASADGVMSDEDLAKSYRSQADRLSKEAAQLRRDAEDLVPTKKKKA
jgi:hypothetical protein|tara:strand:+ start:300 stop:899 length:600 start_codon:yes stop_codon:yes gene_type:complete